MRQERIGFRPYGIAPGVIPPATRIAGGFLLGVLAVRGFREVFLNQVGYLAEGTLQELARVIFQPRALLFYLLKRNLAVYAALLLILMTAARRWGMNLYLGGVGAMQGVFFMTAMLRYGAKGAALYLVAAFPQILAFAPWLYLVYGWGGRGKKIGLRGLLEGAGLLAAASWMQSYVNPFLIQKFLQNFF